MEPEASWFDPFAVSPSKTTSPENAPLPLPRISSRIELPFGARCSGNAITRPAGCIPGAQMRRNPASCFKLQRSSEPKTLAAAYSLRSEARGSTCSSAFVARNLNADTPDARSLATITSPGRGRRESLSLAGNWTLRLGTAVPACAFWPKTTRQAPTMKVKFWQNNTIVEEFSNVGRFCKIMIVTCRHAAVTPHRRIAKRSRNPTSRQVFCRRELRKGAPCEKEYWFVTTTHSFWTS